MAEIELREKGYSEKEEENTWNKGLVKWRRRRRKSYEMKVVEEHEK